MVCKCLKIVFYTFCARGCTRNMGEKEKNQWVMVF